MRVQRAGDRFKWWPRRCRVPDVRLIYHRKVEQAGPYKVETVRIVGASPFSRPGWRWGRWVFVKETKR